jgi:hypothetical protein
MSVQQSTTVRNAKLDAVETAIGVTPVLKFFSGAQPANCAASNSGTVLGTGTLPSDWMAAASGGTKSLLGTWTITGAAGASTGTDIGHYRLYASDGTTCHEQGSVTDTGGGGDMTLDNSNIASGQVVTVTSYTKTAGNA